MANAGRYYSIKDGLWTDIVRYFDDNIPDHVTTSSYRLDRSVGTTATLQTGCRLEQAKIAQTRKLAIVSTERRLAMIVETLAIFFVEHIGAVLLDKFIQRVTGEARRRSEIEATIKASAEKQDRILEILLEDKQAYYEQGIAQLKLARGVEFGGSGYKTYLRAAVLSFTRCESLRYFTGIQRAHVFIDRAICHHLLGERRNAISALREGLAITEDVAKHGGGTFERQQTSESIEIHLPGGRTITGVRWIERYMPQLRIVAGELSGEIRQALATIEAR